MIGQICDVAKTKKLEEVGLLSYATGLVCDHGRLWRGLQPAVAVWSCFFLVLRLAVLS